MYSGAFCAQVELPTSRRAGQKPCHPFGRMGVRTSGSVRRGTLAVVGTVKAREVVGTQPRPGYIGLEQWHRSDRRARNNSVPDAIERRPRPIQARGRAARADPSSDADPRHCEVFSSEHPRSHLTKKLCPIRSSSGTANLLWLDRRKCVLVANAGWKNRRLCVIWRERSASGLKRMFPCLVSCLGTANARVGARLARGERCVVSLRSRPSWRRCFLQ